MRIDRPDKPIPYFNKRDQRRLLMQAMMLIIVVVAIFKAANPDNWVWLTGRVAAEQQQTLDEKTPATDGERDLRIRDQEPKLNPGEFHSPRLSTLGKSESPNTNDSKTDVEPIKTDEPVAQEKPPAENPDWPSHLLEVPAEVLAPIEDNTLEVRPEETSGFYTVLARIRDLDDGVAGKAATKNTGWVVLMDEPEFYRGRLVTIRGDLHRLQEIKANKNDHGIETMYSAWISTRDRPKDPIHIFTTLMPAEIPRGRELGNPLPVTVVGYFFKKEGYFTDPTKAAGTHVAPLVLAKTLQLKTAGRTVVDDDSGVLTYLISFAAVLFVVVFLWTWSNRRSDAAFKRGALKQVTTAPDDAIEALNDIEAKELGDQLRDLAKEDL